MTSLERLALWTALGSVLAALVSLALTAVVLVRLPADAFTQLDAEPVIRKQTAPGLLLKIFGNAAGWFLIVLGAVMAIPGVPGQGILTILIGLLLVDFPGRTCLLRRILGYPKVRQGLDRLRAGFRKPPFLWNAD